METENIQNLLYLNKIMIQAQNFFKFIILTKKKLRTTTRLIYHLNFNSSNFMSDISCVFVETDEHWMILPDRRCSSISSQPTRYFLFQ